MSNPITVAFVGLGRSGWNIHFRPISKMDGFRIVAVADPDPARRQEAADLTGCEMYDGIDALLAGSDAQLVVIATPSALHYSDARKVLEAGRHCLLEKPMALNTEDANTLVTLAQEKQRQLFVNHTHLYLPDYSHLRAIVESGVLGPIFHFRTFWASYRRRWDWQTLRKNGGGELNNTCSHVLAVVLPLLGSPVKSISADLRNIKNAGDSEDHVQLLLTTESGVTADITVSTAIAVSGVPRWIIAGKYGTLSSDGTTTRLRYFDPAQLPNITAIDSNAAPNREYSKEEIPWVEKELRVEPSPFPPPHQNILDVLLGRAEPVVTPESAAEVTRITELAFCAAAQKA